MCWIGLVDMLGLPGKFKSDSSGGGVIQDTASNASLCALLAARERATDYVSNEGLRLQLYRRMGNITAAEEIDALVQELIDRFGPLPQPVENLVFQLHLKVLAAGAHLTSIVRDRERGNIVLKSEALEHVDRIALQRRLGSSASVQRREIHIPMDEAWKIQLVKVLREITDF